MKKYTWMTLLLVLFINNLCAQPRTTNIVIVLDDGSTLDIGNGEIIEIHDKGCSASEFMVDGVCTDRWTLQDLCDFNIGLCSNEPPPGGQQPDPNPSPPEDEKPTEQKCLDAYFACTKDAQEGLQNCNALMAYTATMEKVRNNRTCFGNEQDLLDQIGQGCTLDHLRLPVSAGDFQSLMCTGIFRNKALEQCLNGIEKGGGSGVIVKSVSITLAGFVNLGIGPESIPIRTPDGQGTRGYYAEKTSKIEKACEQAHSECIEIAKGDRALRLTDNAPIDFPLKTDQYLEQIDKDRLGLKPASLFKGGDEGAVAGSPVPKFRGLARGETESETLHEMRIKFLANYSSFLKSENVSRETQVILEKQFEGAQTSFNAIYDDLISILVSAYVVDPKTKKMGTVESRKIYKEFKESRTFRKRVDQLESQFLSIVERRIVGRKSFPAFKEKVWPGLQQFGIAQPMVNKPKAEL